MATVSAGPLAALFVSNVLNGTVAANAGVVNKGTVERLTLQLRGSKPPLLIAHTVIGSGFGEHTDPAALVVGPTGLGLDSHGTLFVADSAGNRITAIPSALVRLSSAGTGNVVTTGGKLNTRLGLAIAPNGNVLTVNGGNGLLVETSPAGQQIASKLLDKTGSPPGAGALFGLALTPQADGIYYVDDAANTLKLLH
jgi:sugar lactone lactonase YvrE